MNVLAALLLLREKKEGLLPNLVRQLSIRPLQDQLHNLEILPLQSSRKNNLHDIWLEFLIM